MVTTDIDADAAGVDALATGAPSRTPPAPQSVPLPRILTRPRPTLC